MTWDTVRWLWMLQHGVGALDGLAKAKWPSGLTSQAYDEGRAAARRLRRDATRKKLKRKAHMEIQAAVVALKRAGLAGATIEACAIRMPVEADIVIWERRCREYRRGDIAV